MKLKRNLAVSTVIANMMMIAITLSLAAILVAWAGTSYGTFSSGSQLFFAERGQALQESFVVEEVFFNKTAPDQIYIFVRNVGLLNINIMAIYVNGTALTPVSTGHGSTCTFSGTPPSASLGVGSVCEFSVNWPTSSCSPNYCPWVTGNIFYIVVASARGNQVACTARGP
jgi:FlaG/FlaF family flagellin (archaellin)